MREIEIFQELQLSIDPIGTPTSIQEEKIIREGRTRMVYLILGIRLVYPHMCALKFYHVSSSNLVTKVTLVPI